MTLFRDDAAIRTEFEEEDIDQIDIRKVLDEILATQPLLGMPIDAVSADLREWASTSVKLETKLWIVRKHVELGNPHNVIYELPEEYRPAFDSHQEEEAVSTGGLTLYDVSVQDLVESGLLDAGSKLFMSYKRKHFDENRKTYEAVVQDDGSIRADDQKFTSPSYAALYFINKAGSPRQTVNGWTSWRTESGRLLAELRDQFLRNSATSNNVGNRGTGQQVDNRHEG